MDFTFRMYSKIKFNRPINRDTDCVSPGGYEFVMNGKTVAFDFEDFEGSISKDDPTVLEVMQKNPDYDTFPDLNSVTVEDLENVEKIEEFYVYTGEDDEPGSDLAPVSLLELWFWVIPQVGDKFIVDCPNVIPYAFPSESEETAVTADE